MDVVVERGLARCPRCAATADYCFIECGTEAIRYEIECRMCGELYCEQNSTSPAPFARTTAFVVPAPVAAPTPGLPDRLVAEVRRWWSAAVAWTARVRASERPRLRR